MAERKSTYVLSAEFLNAFEKEHTHGQLPSDWLSSFQLLTGTQKWRVLNAIGSDINKLYKVKCREKNRVENRIKETRKKLGLTEEE